MAKNHKIVQRLREGEERPGLVSELRALEKAAGAFSRRCEAQGEVRASIQVVMALAALKRGRVALGNKRRGATS